jgi:electron transport complex protein RnfG
LNSSTITSRAFLKAINQAYAVYAKKDVDGESGASQKADAESGASKVEHNEKKG